MASNTKELNVSELDFDLIKQNLIDYFKTDSTFADFAFEGSALNILLDILAYNTHMNAVMANMSANEMFIDSAQLRQSIISLAKLISYTPRSVITSQASVKIIFSSVSGSPAYVEIPSGTRFSSAPGYVFSTKESYLAYPDTELGTGYYSASIIIYEGLTNEFKYTVNSGDLDQAFIIPSVNADISSLVVTVLTGSTLVTYTHNENITLLTSTSNVYFLHENPNGYFEVTFGDGILGKKLIDGSVVTLSYVVSSAGEEANNISAFSPYQPISGFSSYTITTEITSFGAAERESQEEIQYRAPKMYKSQNRAVTTGDYENFMLKEYPFIETMAVWGGEYNEPPVYGKIFLAIKPSHTEFLSDNLKAKIKEELISKYNIVTVIPEIIDPSYLYVLFVVSTIFRKDNTTLTESNINNLVKNSISSYSSSSLQKFNVPLYHSTIVSLVKDSDTSIVSALVDVLLMMKVYPRVNISERHVLNFNNALVQGTLYSSTFNSGITGSTAKQSICDSNGILYTKNFLTGETILSNIGTIDYETGEVIFTVLPYSLPTDTLDIRIYVSPLSENVYPKNNQILVIDSSAERQDVNRTIGVSVSTVAVSKEYK